MSNTVIKTLKRGIKVGETIYKEVELREVTVAQGILAEKEASALTHYAHQSALLCHSIVRLGVNFKDTAAAVFTGPFTSGMFSDMGRGDFGTLVAGMGEAEELGNE